MPRATKIVLFSFLLLSFFGFVFVSPINTAFADDPCKNIEDLDNKAECYEKEIEEREEKYESTSKKLEDVRNQKNSVTSKISNLLGQLSVTQEELTGIQNEINDMNETLEEIKANLQDKNSQLGKKVDLRNRIVRNYTKRGVLNELETFFAQRKESGLNGFQYSTASYIFQKTLNEESIRLINILNTEITNFEKDKKEAEDLKNELETAQASLISAKNQLENQKNQEEGTLDVLADKEGDYEGELKSLSARIAELSAKQQEVLSAKNGGDNGSVGDYESPTWKTPDAPFKPAFAAFSYGAYTHYKGMSQYGAKGRAEDGQSYEDIIKFYYKKDVEEKDDFPEEVNVDGYGELDFQYYLYGLAEMPSDWPEDALKAQAIAGRTYAYRYIKAGKSICTSQSCQVFLKSKADNPPSRWKEAVDDTEGMIIEGDTHAMYSSTTGGYIDDVGWDGKWPNDSYESKAESPWFYWAWYSKSYTFNSDTCGHSHPWLSEKEMADILNAYVVLNDRSDSKVSPLTTNCWGGDPYSMDDLREKADDISTGYSKVTNIDVTVGNNGQTTQVTLSTDKGTITVDGQAFKKAFNLRAPGYVSIRSRLYDFQVK